MDRDIRSSWRLFYASNFEGVSDEDLIKLQKDIPSILENRNVEKIKNEGYPIDKVSKLNDRYYCDNIRCPLKEDCANVLDEFRPHYDSSEIIERNLTRNTPKLVTSKTTENVYCLGEWAEPRTQGRVFKIGDHFGKSESMCEHELYELIVV